MDIRSIDKTQNSAFKGWGATHPLSKLVLSYPGSDYGIMNELDAIGKQVGFDVLVLSGDELQSPEYINEYIPVKKSFLNFFEKIGKFILRKKYEQKENFIRRGTKYDSSLMWLQDVIKVIPKGSILGDSYKKICLKSKWRTLGSLVRNCNTQAFDTEWCFAGGNMYFVKNKDGYELLIGKAAIDEEPVRFLDYEIILPDKQTLCRRYGVNNVTIVPSMDYHLDLYIRPLDDKQVLLTDDNMTLDVIKKGISVFEEKALYCTDNTMRNKYDLITEKLKKIYDKFVLLSSSSTYASSKSSEKCLLNAGYKVVKVPGRIYTEKNIFKDFKHHFNYMNAIVTKNKNGELVYITNKSTFDEELGITPEIAKESGFSFENEFKKSISGYVKPENIFFIKGYENEMQKLLTDYDGAIHCLTMEIPEILEE